MNHKSVTNGVPVTTSIASIQPGMKNLLLECIVVQICKCRKNLYNFFAVSHNMDVYNIVLM